MCDQGVCDLEEVLAFKILIDGLEYDEDDDHQDAARAAYVAERVEYRLVRSLEYHVLAAALQRVLEVRDAIRIVGCLQVRSFANELSLRSEALGTEGRADIVDDLPVAPV